MLLVWVNFLALGAVIAVSGFWLSRFADVISERTGLSGSWIGLALTATVTSLPELVAGVSSVTIVQAPDLAVGDALGSCLFNLLLLVLVDFACRPVCLFTRASRGHALSIGYSAVLLGVVGLSMIGPAPWPRAPVGLATMLSLPIYLLALRSVFTFERRQLVEPVEPTTARYPGVTLKRAVIGYAAAALFVVSAGVQLPGAALGLAEVMMWSDSFVGTLFLAVATSVPEAVVVLSAVRIGALDMAVATLLGSNLFNMLVLAVDDLVYPAGPLLAHAEPAHLASVLTALAMNGVVTVGLINRPSARPGGAVTWTSLALIAFYVANAWLLFAGGVPRG